MANKKLKCSMRFLLFIFLVLLLGCDNNSLSGKYVLVKDNGKGNIVDAGLISEFEFKEDYCKFTYFGSVTMSGKYKIDKGSVFINAGGEFGILSLDIVDNNTLEGTDGLAGTFKKTKD